MSGVRPMSLGQRSRPQSALKVCAFQNRVQPITLSAPWDLIFFSRNDHHDKTMCCAQAKGHGHSRHLKFVHSRFENYLDKVITTTR